MALVLAKSDNQNGFLDRFIISVPVPFRPLPDYQVEATNRLRNIPFDLNDIYKKLFDITDEDNDNQFYFERDALQ